jgi:hypothetical protein
MNMIAARVSARLYGEGRGAVELLMAEGSGELPAEVAEKL